jgi:hypothetical protein
MQEHALLHGASHARRPRCATCVARTPPGQSEVRQTGPPVVAAPHHDIYSCRRLPSSSVSRARPEAPGNSGVASQSPHGPSVTVRRTLPTRNIDAVSVIFKPLDQPWRSPASATQIESPPTGLLPPQRQLRRVQVGGDAGAALIPPGAAHAPQLHSRGPGWEQLASDMYGGQGLGRLQG